MLSFGAFFLVVFTILLAILIAAFLFFNKESRIHNHVDVKDKVTLIKKFLPLIRNKGWRLCTVNQGLCVWEKECHLSWASYPVQACSVTVPSSPKTVLELLSNNSVRLDWDYSVGAINNVTMTTAKYHMLTDVISIKPSSNALGCIGYLWSVITRKDHIACSRFWHEENDNECWLLSMNIEATILEPEWTCYIINGLKSEGHTLQIEQTQITALAVPATRWLSFVNILTSRMTGIREHLTNHVKDSNQSHSQINNLEELENGEEKEPTIETFQAQSASQQILFTKVAEDKSAIYHEQIQEGKKDLMEAYLAEDGQDGWSFYQDYKGVTILKRAAVSGISNFDTYKGTAVINVPAVYALHYCTSLEHRSHWDADNHSGVDIETFDRLTKVANLKYKAIWPTTARDFCVSTKIFQTEDGLAALSSKSVLHHSCPDNKGYVRAEILVAGFVIKELTSDPPSCSVTYITQADFKGNLPIRLVNRVSSEQPQLVSVLRENVEALFKSDQISEQKNGKITTFHAEADALWNAMVAANSQENESLSTDDMRDSISDLSSLSGDQRRLENGEDDVSSEGIPVSDVMQLPMADRFTVDFKTLGNQAAAGLLGELLLATKVDIDSEPDQPGVNDKIGEWSYQGMEKEVVIMRKIFEDHPFHCFLGKGIIHESPLKIWEIIRDHNTRFQYDRMLKRSKLLKEIDEQTKILYMHLETTQCFVKQARDFVLLASTRVESNKYVLAAVSIDIPECPPRKNLIRSKVIASGWVIEPMLQNGQLHSMVSYLSQVDFGGVVPARLLNVVARRQPLCIAYLREYIETRKAAEAD